MSVNKLQTTDTAENRTGRLIEYCNPIGTGVCTDIVY